MKTLFSLTILFWVIVLPVNAQLKDTDLDKIRLIVHESEKRIKGEVKAEIEASEKRMKEYVDLKIDNINNTVSTEIKRVDDQIKTAHSEIGALRNQNNIFIGIPLAIITLLFAWRVLRDRAIEKQVQALIAENETLKQQQIANP